MRAHVPSLAALAGLVLGALPAASAAQELIGPEKISNLSWRYTLETRSLDVRVCGRFRPGESEQCASAVLADGEKGGNTVDRALAMLRLPRERLGIGISPGTKDFKLTHLTQELLSAPGIGEKAARGTTIELSGESLTQVLWIQGVTKWSVTVRVCGKLANPEYVGCAQIEETTPRAIGRLRSLFSQKSVEQLEFKLGWDSATRKFTRVLQIGTPSN